MTPEQIFSGVNVIALLAWLMLAALPRQAWVERAVAGLGVPALLAAVYVVLIATWWNGSEGGFSTLAGVAQLFANPWLLLAGWVHYLCFDLLVGCWELQDARARRVPHWLVVPCLLLTFMFGPAGWLLYRAVRTGYRPAATTTSAA